MNTGGSNVLAVALELAVLGLPVFPCTADKKPAIAKQGGGNGYKDAVANPIAVQKLFAKAGKAAKLIGVPTGPRSGFDVLDSDPRHGGDVWEYDHRDQLPETLIRQTPGGGRHYHFASHPDVHGSAGKIAAGVDVRGTGGYVCFGAGYRVIHTAELALWPDWLLDLICKKEPAAVPRPAVVSDPEAITDCRLKGLLGALLDNIAAARDGTKHNTLRNIARTIGGYTHLLEIGDDHLIELMIAALPATAKDLNNARTTARWGLAEGRKQPLDLPDRLAFVDPSEPDKPPGSGSLPVTREQAKSIARATYTLLRQRRPRDQAWAELKQFAASIWVGPETARRIAQHCIDQHRGDDA
jgi:hypothetical protein